MKTSTQNEKGYSKVQYLLWLIAGSEISTLKNCPNDYNRHANIGLMILITSLFAGMMGYIAGDTFVKDKNWAVLIFAFVWAFLIFSMDRSMVNSIKKDPTQPALDFWKYFTPRFMLAVILSFFMSIPLDHIVFHEKIKFQMDKNNANNWLNRQLDLNKGYNFSSDTLRESRLDNEVEKINSLLETGCSACPIPEYRKLTSELATFNKTLPSLLSKRNSDNVAFNNYYSVWKNNQVEVPAENQKWDSKLNTLNNVKRVSNTIYNSKKAEANKLASKANSICNEWKTEIRLEKIKKDSTLEKTRLKVEASRDSIETQSTRYKKEIEEMEGFDTQFTTLFMMPDYGVQVLKWLIFLALLVIEILPTYLKLKTPSGQYDWEIYKKDKITEIEIVSKIENLKGELDKIEKYRSQKELELNKQIIDKMADIEQRLANKTLEDWENSVKNNSLS